MQEYDYTDQQIHQLSQTIAKFNRSFAEPMDDDSHTNLGFDALGKRLLGKWVNTSHGKVIMSLNLVDFIFVFHNASWQKLKVVDIVGNTQSEIEAVIQNYLPELGLDSNAFIQPLHFEIPVYEFNSKPYSALSQNGMNQWITHRTLANDACQWLLNHIQIHTETRIWPHHFDTGIYAQTSSKLALGFGLAMKDDVLGAPYFYFSGYGLNGHEIPFDVNHKLKHGKWVVSEHFKSAVLPLESASKANISDFTSEVLDWYLSH